jgi:hypothetical protein
VFLGFGRMGKLSSMFGGCVSVMWGDGSGGCALSAACVSSHVRMLMSGACPRIWHLSLYVKPGAAVVPGWNPIRCSLIAAFGSVSVSLW